MKRSNRYIAPGVVVVLVLAAAGIGLFFLAFERVEREVREPPSGEARRNPYLALDTLLYDLGHLSETVGELDGPPPDDTMVLLLGDQHSMHPDSMATWVRWVEGGKHLVLVQPKEGHDPILEALGFHFGTPPRPDAPEGAPEDAPAGDTAHGYTPATPPNFEVYSASGIRPHLRWTADDLDWVATLPHGRVFAVSRRHMYGRVTVLASAAMFENRNIGEGQAATLARDLVVLGEPAGGTATVTIVQYGQRISWVMHVAPTFWPVLLVLAIALLLGLNVGRAPFGPRLEPPPPGRRSRAEHIGAMGRFLWRFDASRVLVEATREALLQQLVRRRPAIATLRDAKRAALVAEELGVSPEEARRLLDAPVPVRSQHFFDLIHTLENHRRSL